MARLPNREQAFIGLDKIENYLLAKDHPEGGAKAVFLTAMGFEKERPDQMRDALFAHAEYDISASVKTTFGVKYIIEGALHSPTGVSAMVRSVWIIEVGESRPRFVTAYPLEGLS